MSDSSTWQPVVVVMPADAVRTLLAVTVERWETLEAIDPKAAETLLGVMAANGWTDYAVVGGQMLATALRA